MVVVEGRATLLGGGDGRHLVPMVEQLQGDR